MLGADVRLSFLSIVILLHTFKKNIEVFGKNKEFWDKYLGRARMID